MESDTQLLIFTKAGYIFCSEVALHSHPCGDHKEQHPRKINRYSNGKKRD